MDIREVIMWWLDVGEAIGCMVGVHVVIVYRRGNRVGVVHRSSNRL